MRNCACAELKAEKGPWQNVPILKKTTGRELLLNALVQKQTGHKNVRLLTILLLKSVDCVLLPY